MSDNKFAQRMAEAGIVPEEFALAVLGGGRRTGTACRGT